MEKNKKPLSISINTKKESATGVTVEKGTQKAEVQNIEVAPKVEVVTMPTMPSIEELQAKAEKTAQLVSRYQTIKSKKAEVDSFVILHDSNQAQITIRDVNGREIVTNNPKTIGQVLTTWKADIAEALVKSEQEIREIMSAQQATPEVLSNAA